MLPLSVKFRLAMRRNRFGRWYLARKRQAQYDQWIANGRRSGMPDLYRQKIIQGAAEIRKLDVFVETGTYFGDMTAAVEPFFTSIHTIELDPDLYAMASKRFRSSPKIHLHLGDSGSELPKVLAAIDRPALFWLDAHWAGDLSSGGDYVPILAEFEAIARHPSAKDHVIVVDDTFLFDGTRGYPTLEALCSQAASLGFRHYHLYTCVIVFDSRGGLASITT